MVMVRAMLISSLVSRLSFIVTQMAKIAKNTYLPYEIRKLQESRGLIFLNIPKRFTELLKLKKQDIIKVQLVSDEIEGNSLSLTKVNVQGEQ